jgi:hypothetical protein
MFVRRAKTFLLKGGYGSECGIRDAVGEHMLFMSCRNAVHIKYIEVCT